MPQQGRFNAEDTVRDGLNWYEYCRGNPLRFVDPTGLVAHPNPTLDSLRNNNPALWGMLQDPHRDGGPQRSMNEHISFNGPNVNINNININLEHEFGFVTESPNGILIRAFYGRTNGPQIRNGVELGGVEVGVLEISGQHPLGGWSFSTMSADARVGFTRQYVGGSVGARMFAAGKEFEFPLWSNRVFIFGAEGEFLAAGLHGEVSDGRVRIGGSFGVGGNLVFGIGNRNAFQVEECDLS